MKIQSVKSLNGKVRLPGDKSISHRAAILASMAEGETRIENFGSSADCASTLNCLEKLGVEIKRENTTILIGGVGKKVSQNPFQNSIAETAVRQCVCFQAFSPDKILIRF
ncbi:MAG: hypothetical protein WKF71_04625 [Pyrinomonadaceae bacterium]